MSRSSFDDLPERLREIASMGRAECAEALASRHGVRLPPRLREATLQRLLAYAVQAEVLGGLSARERRILRSIASGQSFPEARPDLSKGSHLVREWNGRTYRVEVTDAGYVLDGRIYGSLSAVARRITGTAWSGPRFFGLAGKRSA